MGLKQKDVEQTIPAANRNLLEFYESKSPGFFLWATSSRSLLWKSALGGYFPKPSFPLSTGIAGNHWLDVGSIKSVLIQPKYLGKKPKMGAWECRERWREGRSWRNRGIEALLHFSQLYFYPNFLIFPKFCSFQVHQYWGISCSSAPHGMGEQFNLQHDKMIIPNIFSTQKKKKEKSNNPKLILTSACQDKVGIHVWNYRNVSLCDNLIYYE